VREGVSRFTGHGGDASSARSARKEDRVTMTFPAMPLYVQDLISDPKVETMCNEAFAAYVRLICYCWIEGSVPDDDSALSKLTRTGRRWARISRAVKPCFVQASVSKKRVLIHKRVEVERQKLLSHRAKRQAAARSRWGKRDDANASAMHMLSSSSSSSSTLPLTPPTGSGSIDDEKAEQRYVERYASELSADEFTVVHDVLTFVNTNLRTKKELNIAKRVEHLNVLSRYPAIQVGKACHDFKEQGCVEAAKRFNYLHGIVRNSAGIWYREYKAAQDKRRFDLT